MRKQRSVLAMVVVMGLGLSACEVVAQTGKNMTIPFMRMKLDYAQFVLEGITLEKPDLVVTNALLLRNMNLTNAFFALGNTEYRRAITNFQASADRLISAANAKNQENMTEAYAKMVTSCVECHQVFRHDQALRLSK